jgi:hypothetical protein
VLKPDGVRKTQGMVSLGSKQQGAAIIDGQHRARLSAAQAGFHFTLLSTSTSFIRGYSQINSLPKGNP